MDEVDTQTELKYDIVIHDDAVSAFDRAMAARYGDDSVPFSEVLDAVARDMPNALKMLEES